MAAPLWTSRSISVRLVLASLALLAGLTACEEEAPASDPPVADEPAAEDPAADDPAAEDPAPEPSEEPEPPAADATGGFNTTGWQELLTEYVTDDGGFRYAALRDNETHMATLRGVTGAVGTAEPDGWSRDAQLAFYINAYNALTVQSVLAHWPLESVMSVEGFFDGETHTVAGTERTLNALENEVIRGERFAEPRIHFAVNCASAGCPWLSDTAFTADNLEAQLTEGARSYVRRTTVLDREGNVARSSQIFEWFAADFEAGGGVRSFLAAQLEGEDAAFVSADETTLAHFQYDWASNARD